MSSISLTKYQQQESYNFGVKKGGHPPSLLQSEGGKHKKVRQRSRGESGQHSSKTTQHSQVPEAHKWEDLP